METGSNEYEYIDIVISGDGPIVIDIIDVDQAGLNDSWGIEIDCESYAGG